MVLDHSTVWDKCLNTIRQNVNSRSFKTWFEPIKSIKLNENSLTIQVPNKFFYEWLESNYVSLLKSSITNELGKTARLEYHILGNSASSKSQNSGFAKTTTRPADNGKRYTPGMITGDKIKNPFVIPGIKKVKVESRLNPTYTFDSFIEGDCNRLARNAGLAIAKNPGGTSFNPLVVYGDVGLGKTHLAQSIGNSILAENAEMNVLYVSSEKFTNQIINAIKNNAVSDLVTYYQLMDVLIVDDIQFLKGREKTQEIFFNIFNQLHQNRKQIILTSDRAPKDLEGIRERLTSRFKWGLSTDLSVPDFETRIAIFESKMNREGIELPPNVIEFICYNINNNIRELEGALNSIIAQSSLSQRAVDLELAKEIVRTFVKQMNKEITIEYILDLVSEHFKVPVDTLQSKTRKRHVVIARQMSMYLIQKLTDQTLKTIGDTLGGRDHSTVIHAVKTIRDLIETDILIKEAQEELEKKIRLSLND